MYLRIAGKMITLSTIILTENRSRTITENTKDLATSSFKSSFIPENLLTYTKTTSAVYAPKTLQSPLIKSIQYCHA